MFSKPDRSEIMRRVHSRDTTPEIKVRSLLHRIGYRFRIYSRDLPGKPDIILPKYKTAIFVHGCFWHRHKDCKRATTPATRQEYWLLKFKRTVNRDKKYRQQLIEMGWKVIVIWECQTKDIEKLAKDLIEALPHVSSSKARTTGARNLLD